MNTRDSILRFLTDLLFSKAATGRTLAVRRECPYHEFRFRPPAPGP